MILYLLSINTMNVVIVATIGPRYLSVINADAVDVIIPTAGEEQILLLVQEQVIDIGKTESLWR